MYSYVRKCPYPVVQLLSRVWLLVILWIVACQTPMAPQSSTLAWKIPWAEEPGRLQSMGLLKVGQDWVTSLSLFTFMHWRMKWQPTPVFLPGESQGWGSLEGCRLWDYTESDTTEVMQQQQQQQQQTPMSSTVSWSLLKFMFKESVMLFYHLILCHALLFPSISPSIRVFSSELLFVSGGQSVGASTSATVLPMNIQGWFL